MAGSGCNTTGVYSHDELAAANGFSFTHPRSGLEEAPSSTGEFIVYRWGKFAGYSVGEGQLETLRYSICKTSEQEPASNTGSQVAAVDNPADASQVQTKTAEEWREYYAHNPYMYEAHAQQSNNQ